MLGPQPAPDLPSVGAEADPLPGRVLNGRYRVLEGIGHGGMGRVYKALQAPLDRVVALKILGPGHDKDPIFFRRFFLEATVTARLTHPNTITLYDYGRTDDGIFFIAMEFLDGRTLSQVLQAEGPLGQERVVRIAQQICRSLREAHSLGIIHRDLKPANVMLLHQGDDHDFVKVLDFGLVKSFSGAITETEITNTGTFMGSPHYIAPEQARNQRPDQRCDIYSLGVLLYHMLTGRVPFTAGAPVEIILKHLHDAPPAPRSLRPDLEIDPQLEDLVLRCMAKDRGERFQSMDEVLAHLKAVGARRPPPAPADAFDDLPTRSGAPQPALPPPIPPAQASAPGLWTALPPAFIVIAGIGTAAYVVRAPRPGATAAVERPSAPNSPRADAAPAAMISTPTAPDGYPSARAGATPVAGIPHPSAEGAAGHRHQSVTMKRARANAREASTKKRAPSGYRDDPY